MCKDVRSMGIWRSIGIVAAALGAAGAAIYVGSKIISGSQGPSQAERMKAELDILTPVGSGKMALLYEVYRGENVYYVTSVNHPELNGYCWANAYHFSDIPYGFGTSPVCPGGKERLWLIHAVIDEMKGGASS